MVINFITKHLDIKPGIFGHNEFDISTNKNNTITFETCNKKLY